MCSRLALCALTLSLLAPVCVAAQDSSVLALRERVAAMRDTAELRRMEREQETSRTAAHDLAAGFAALQLWEITRDRAHAARARRHFDRAADREPQNAWAHYGHALSFAPELDREGGFIVLDDVLTRATGLDALSRARRALERAVTLDPTLPGAAELLATYAVHTRDGSALEQSRAALTAATSAPNAPTEALLGLARTARDQGDYAAAADAAERAAARGDGHFAAAHYEMARALASVPDGRVAAGNAYFTALDQADEALLALMWEDADIIARQTERERWQQASTLDRKRVMLREYWQIRGALAATTAAARVAEHYARSSYAWQRYRRWGRYGAAPLNALRWEKIDERYSDPGIIYIRHGAPDDVYRFGAPPPTAGATIDDPGFVWYYRDEEGGPLSFHFAIYGNAGWARDPVLKRKVGCVAPEVALRDPRLRPLTYGCNPTRVEMISAKLRRDYERALRTETHTPDFAREIHFHFDLFTFRGENGATDVAVGIGVPFRNLSPTEAPLLLSLSIVDTARYRTVRASATAPPQLRVEEPGAMLRAHLALKAEPAQAAAYRVLVQDAAGAAGKVYGGHIDVPDYSGTSLMISDVVLAEPASEGNFERGGQRLALMPSQVFPGGRFRAYYEIYNLPGGSSYRTQITIETANRGLGSRLLGRGESVHLQYDDVAPDTATGLLREVREFTAPLAPGAWVMRINVTAQDGSRFQRERRFTIPRP